MLPLAQVPGQVEVLGLVLLKLLELLEELVLASEAVTDLLRLLEPPPALPPAHHESILLELLPPERPSREQAEADWPRRYNHHCHWSLQQLD